MNQHQIDIAILSRLLHATATGAIVWKENEHGLYGLYTTIVGNRDIHLRFVYLEATNIVGADRRMIDLHMPGRNTGFACGTEGWELALKILEQAFSHKEAGGDDALRFLDEFLPT